MLYNVNVFDQSGFSMFKMIFVLVLLTILAVLGLYFGFSNTSEVEVNLLFMTAKTTVAVLVSSSMLFGFTLALLLGLLLKAFRGFLGLFSKKQPKLSKSVIINSAESASKSAT